MARANIELDSFYVKFKTLLHAGKDATLFLKSNVGKAIVTLSVDLGQISVPDQRPTGPETVLQDSVAVRDVQLLVLRKHRQPEWLLRILFALK